MSGLVSEKSSSTVILLGQNYFRNNIITVRIKQFFKLKLTLLKEIFFIYIYKRPNSKALNGSAVSKMAILVGEFTFNRQQCKGGTNTDFLAASNQPAASFSPQSRVEEIKLKNSLLLIISELFICFLF